MTNASVDGIVLAAGRGDRLGLGPKAWLTLGGHVDASASERIAEEVPA